MNYHGDTEDAEQKERNDVEFETNAKLFYKDRCCLISSVAVLATYSVLSVPLW
jgi:hypothetical protein